jgi:hypothetical protein
MSIKINVVKKLSKDGEKMVSLKISGIYGSASLPVEYTSGFPAVWMNDTMSLYVHTDNQERQDQYRNTYPENKTCIAEYLINRDIPLDQAEYLIRKIQESGARLHTIMEAHRKNAVLYEGETEITI